MKPSTFLLLLCLIPLKICSSIEFPGNPFSFFRKLYAQRDRTKPGKHTISTDKIDGTSSSDGSSTTTSTGDGGGGEFMGNLRDELIRSNVNINSRDEIVSSAINLVSSIGTAAVYAFVVRSIMKSVGQLMSEFQNISNSISSVNTTSLTTPFEKKYLKENMTLNSFELEVLSSSIIEPSSSQIEVDFDDISGLEEVKYGLLDCCHLLDEMQEEGEEGGDDDEVHDVNEESVEGVDLDVDSELLALNKTTLSHLSKSTHSRHGNDDNSNNNNNNNNNEHRGSRNSLIRPVQGILLYGPPGCGKTALTRALGKKCNLPIIQFAPSTLLRKWVGETPQLLKAIMSLVIKIQPCILFIDEMDGLFRARTHDDNTVDRQIKTEFMQLWDDIFRNPANQVLVIGASNRPQDLDAAIQRRFERSYLVDMPDEKARVGIFKKMLRPMSVESGFSYRACAVMTAKYTPSDIVSICKAAACIPLREQQQLRREMLEEREMEMKEAREAADEGNSSSNSTSTSASSGSGRENMKVSLRPLSVMDIREALRTVIPSTVVEARYVKGYNEPRHRQPPHSPARGYNGPPRGTMGGPFGAYNGGGGGGDGMGGYEGNQNINRETGKFQYTAEDEDEDDGYDDGMEYESDEEEDE